VPGEPLLEVLGLSVRFDGPRGTAMAVDDLTLRLDRGRTLGLVGESGSGKSITALAILGLLPPGARVTAGRIVFEGLDLLAASERERRRIRGSRLALIFQEPSAALNPVMRIGPQVTESLRVHGRADRRTARRKAIDLLEAVRMPDAARVAEAYPHQLSGGMRQRALIASALACEPALLVADEPTTALDVTIQAEVLDLLRDLRDRYRLALLLITHDLGVVAGMADRVAVMHRGRIVEEDDVRRILRTPSHAYTRRLLDAVPGRVERA
jgi:ABC-type dipeptide/oligopeptide/nickel transport system ATPase component